MYEYHKKNFFLNEMFPNQFNTIPRIIIWTLVFIVDVVLVFVAAHLMGFRILDAVNIRLTVIIYLVIAFALFCLESFVYNRIRQ